MEEGKREGSTTMGTTFLVPGGAAAVAHVSKQTVLSWIDTGQLPTYQVCTASGRIRLAVDVDDLRRMPGVRIDEHLVAQKVWYLRRLADAREREESDYRQVVQYLEDLDRHLGAPVVRGAAAP